MARSTAAASVISAWERSHAATDQPRPFSSRTNSTPSCPTAPKTTARFIATSQDTVRMGASSMDLAEARLNCRGGVQHRCFNLAPEVRGLTVDGEGIQRHGGIGCPGILHQVEEEVERARLA